MKRFFSLIAFVALAACSPKTAKINPIEPGGDKDPVVSGYTIKAPTLNDGTVLSWKKGERVLVCDSKNNTYILTASADGNSAVFTGDVPDSPGNFKALYPAGCFISSSSANNFTIKVENTQKSVQGGMAPSQMPMVYNGTGKLSDGFTFSPLAAALRFTISGTDVKSVNFSVAEKDENYLGGDIIGVNTVTLNTSIQNATKKYFSITVSPSSGSAFAPGVYCISILTKSSARSISGYTLTYSRSNGQKTIRNFSGVLSLSSGDVSTIPGDENTSASQKSSLVFGCVKNASTKAPVPDVLVSDGLQIVKTASDGSYSFTSDLTKAQNVFVIMPAEYEFGADKYGTWSNHSLLDVSKSEQQIDFELTPRAASTDRYRILLLGDPQQMSSRAHSGESWTYVTNAIRDYRPGVSVPLYQISLGDMVTNEIEVSGKAEAYLNKQKACGITTFSIPGNHDHVQKAGNYYDSVKEFSRWFGPYNYAFNLGQQHFIFLDSVAWPDNGTNDYSETLNEQAITFLEKDLSYVDADTPVHIFTHCPLTKKHNAGFPSPSSNSRMIKALAGRTVNMWYGHIHFNSNYSYTASELSSRASGVKSLDSHLVSRCGGCWACSGEVCRDGAPRGFVELDIDGKDVHWQFHSIDANYPHTMYLIAPGRFKGENLANIDNSALYCNIYLWDNKWAVPEVWVNGSKVAVMTKAKVTTDAMNDPMYTHFYNIWKAEGKMAQRDEPAMDYDNMHIFKYTPAANVKSVEVRVVDRWGVTHSQTLSW